MISFKLFTESYYKIGYKLKLKKGDILYHGTSNEINGEINIGSDGILWTADNLIIARMYIPTGMSYSLDLYDTGKFLYENIKKSIKLPQQIDDKYNEIEKKFEELYKIDDIIRYNNKKRTKMEEELDKLYDEKGIHNDEVESKEDELLDFIDNVCLPIENKQIELKKILYAYDLYDEVDDDIRKFIKSKGYTDDDDRYIIINNELQPRKFQDGFVYKLKLKRDVILRDFRDEQDGMYNHLALNMFHKQKENYDGVVIDDLAQSYSMGNYGHYAYGFFDNLFEVVEVIKTTHPERNEI